MENNWQAEWESEVKVFKAMPLGECQAEHTMTCKALGRYK